MLDEGQIKPLRQIGDTKPRQASNTNANADVNQIGSINLAIDFGLNNRPPVNVVPGAQTVAEDGTLTITRESQTPRGNNTSTPAMRPMDCGKS